MPSPPQRPPLAPTLDVAALSSEAGWRMAGVPQRRQGPQHTVACGGSSCGGGGGGSQSEAGGGDGAGGAVDSEDESASSQQTGGCVELCGCLTLDSDLGQ